MKKIIPVLLCLLLSLSLVACGGGTAESETPSVETTYAQLVEYAENGQYLEGWRIYQTNTDLHGYEDADNYKNYCDAMRAYEVGALGTAYGLLLNETVLDAAERLTAIEEKIGFLNGSYKADNGQGSYLHMAIENGKVATQLIGYYDENQEFTYTESDLRHTIISSTYDDGTEFIGYGLYSSVGAEVEIDYILMTFEDSSEIMAIAYEGNEYTTFNGLYDKVS